MSITDLHWLAGLLEGEGSFMHRRLKKGGHLWLGVVMGTTDEDVARHCKAVAGGTVCGPYHVQGYKPTWKWSLNRHAECVELMRALRPLMSARRQTQIDACLAAYAAKTEVPQAARTHCPQGHPYDETNTRVVHRSNGKTVRQCRTCAREQSRKHRANYPEQIRRLQKQWRENNPERARELAREAQARYRAKKRTAEAEKTG